MEYGEEVNLDTEESVSTSYPLCATSDVTHQMSFCLQISGCRSPSSPSYPPVPPSSPASISVSPSSPVATPSTSTFPNIPLVLPFSSAAVLFPSCSQSPLLVSHASPVSFPVLSSSVPSNLTASVNDVSASTTVYPTTQSQTSLYANFKPSLSSDTFKNYNMCDLASPKKLHTEELNEWKVANGEGLPKLNVEGNRSQSTDLQAERQGWIERQAVLQMYQLQQWYYHFSLLCMQRQYYCFESELLELENRFPRRSDATITEAATSEGKNITSWHAEMHTLGRGMASSMKMSNTSRNSSTNSKGTKSIKYLSPRGTGGRNSEVWQADELFDSLEIQSRERPYGLLLAQIQDSTLSCSSLQPQSYGQSSSFCSTNTSHTTTLPSASNLSSSSAAGPCSTSASVLGATNVAGGINDRFPRERRMDDNPWERYDVGIFAKVLLMMFLFDAIREMYLCLIILFIMHVHGCFDFIFDWLSSSSCETSPFVSLEETMLELRRRRQREISRHTIGQVNSRAFEYVPPSSSENSCNSILSQSFGASSSPSSFSSIMSTSSTSISTCTSSSSMQSASMSLACSSLISPNTSSHTISISSCSFVSNLSSDNLDQYARQVWPLQPLRTLTVRLSQTLYRICSLPNTIFCFASSSSCSNSCTSSPITYESKCLYQSLIMFFMTLLPWWNPNPRYLED